MQRECERLRWVRFGYVMDLNDMVISMRSGRLEVQEVNAAAATTVIIERMLRSARSRWRRAMLNNLLKKRPNM
jgi:hypothetical protein